MPSPTYQDVITLVVSLPIRRVRGVLMNVSVQGHFALNNQIFLCGKVYYFNTIIISILIKAHIPSCRFESILSPHFCIKIS